MGKSPSLRERIRRNQRTTGTKLFANLRLKFVHRFRDRQGKLRHYFRRPGCKRVPLPSLPGSAEFVAAYQAALAGFTAPRIEIGIARSQPGSVAAAISTYLGSMDFGGLAEATKRDRWRDLDRFRDAHGEKSFAGLRPKHVQQMLAEKPPHAARNFLKTSLCGPGCPKPTPRQEFG
jgi:hypothetical protein